MSRLQTVLDQDAVSYLAHASRHHECLSGAVRQRAGKVSVNTHTYILRVADRNLMTSTNLFVKPHHILVHLNSTSFVLLQEKFDGQKYVFECQHGANECYGNMVEVEVQKKCMKMESSIVVFN